MSDYLSEAELLGKPAGDGYLSEAELFAAPSDGYLSEAELLGEGRTFLGTAGDIGVSAAKSVVGLGESAVGLGNLATFGALGKGMDAIGYDPKGTQSYLSSLYSAPQQAANARVAQADGFVDTAGAMLDNPSTIGHSIIESGAPMLAGGAIGRGLLAAGGIVPGWIAGAVGEGAVSTGAAAEQLRQDDPDKTLGLGQAGAAIASGIGTTAFSMVGGRLANRLGLGDIDTLLASGADDTVKALGVGEVARRVIGGGISEGAFEELPQSVQEQVWMNAATGKPLLAGTGSAGAQGLITGAAMGSGTNVYTSLVDATQPSETVLSGASADEVAASFAAEVDSELRGLVAPTYAQAQPPVETTGPTFSGALAEAPEQIRALVLDAGARHGVDPALLAAQLKAESNFDANAESPAGALGIAQFMPATAAEYGVDPLDPAQAIDGQARYMARMLERFGGDPAKALAAYNAGPGRVADGSWEGIPETRGYVDKVLADPGLSGQEPARAAETGEQPAETAEPVDQVIAQADTGLDAAIAEPDAPMDAPVAPEGLLALEEEAAAPEAAVAPEVAVPAETVSTAVPETDFGDMPEIAPEQSVTMPATEPAVDPLVEAAPEEQTDRPAPRLKKNHGAGLNTPDTEVAPETPAAPRLGGITMEQVRTVPGADGVRLVHKETGEELLPGRTFATTREARDAFRQARETDVARGTLLALHDDVLSGKVAGNKKAAVALSTVGAEEAARLKGATGLDLEGSRHTIDSFAVRHAYKQHGDAKKEAARGQQALTREDFEKIPEIISWHDAVRPAGQTRQGREGIVYEKRFNGTVFYVEEVRTGKKELAFVTMWKAPATTDAHPENLIPPTQTSETLRGNLPVKNIQPDGTDVNEQRQPEETAQETKPATSESALIVDQQSGQAVTGDATSDKTGDRTADVKAELGAALGRQRAERLIERGTVNVIATQAEAEAMVASAEQGNAPTVKRSENGRIQGLYLNGQVHLVADGIEAGKAHGVLLHELGEHARQLGFAKDAEYREILASLEQRKDARGATGKAIRAAMARVPENTPEAYYWSEVAAYLVEEHADVQTSLIQRLVNFVKKWLFKAGAVSAERFTPADLALFARAAVRAEASSSGAPAARAVRGFMASMAETLGVTAEQLQREYDAVVARYRGTNQWLKAPNGKKSSLNERQWVLVRTPRFKAWFGDWESGAIRTFLDGRPVSTLNGEEFARDSSGDSLIDRVSRWYVENNFSTVRSDALGLDVQLDRRAVKDSVAHGIGRDKASAFAAVPDALKRGMVAYQEPVQGGPSGSMVFHVVAPVRVKGRDMVMDVLVRSDANVNRMYVHEVVLKEKLHSLAFKTGADAVAEQPSGASRNGVIKNVLQRIFSVNRDTVSKVADTNGEPLVVYHGARGDFAAFADENGNKLPWTDGNVGFFFSPDAEFAGSFGDRVIGAFVSIKNPYRSGGFEHTSVTTAFRDRLVARGYDGIISGEVIEGKPYPVEMVAFEPTQIKSATGNTGAFSPTNPDIRYSRATPSPEQTQHETEAAEDHASVAETFAKRRDINPTSRLIASAEYTLSKDPAGQRMVDAAGRQLEHRVQLENAILDGIEPGADAATYRQLHNSFVNTFRALRKQSLASYERVRDYLLAIDKSGRGFRLRHEAGFLVTTPDGTELGVVKTKEHAYALRRDHHADTYGKKGRQGDERVLIADYPIRKNGECPHFYTFLHNICNFLTGRCWVLTPFLEVGARAFGITFA